MGLVEYEKIWFLGISAEIAEGENPNHLVLVAQELYTGQKVVVGKGDFKCASLFDVGESVLVVSFFASIEMGAFLSQEWTLPVNLLDLFAEFRCQHNGLRPIDGFTFADALHVYGIHESWHYCGHTMNDDYGGRPMPVVGADDWAQGCGTYVSDLGLLFSAMKDKIDLPRALFRGSYMQAIAVMERNGVPIDTDALDWFRANWDAMKIKLISAVDEKYRVFDGTIFKINKFKRYLVENGIPWPRLESGELDLADETFKFMSARYPCLRPLREIRSILSKLRSIKLLVGKDGRNRCSLSPFRSKTGRNQPHNSKMIFGYPTWLRNLIKPEEGRVIVYIDFEQQEFGIAAALSSDKNMTQAYETGDPYVAFAIQAGVVPEGATKQSYPEERAMFKECLLGILFGMGADKLAIRIGKSQDEAQDLLDSHRLLYVRFWEWADSLLEKALLTNEMVAKLGWRIQLSGEVNERSLLNFPMQANGSEILRLACVMITEAGVKISAPVHDALLIEASIDRVEEDIIQTQALMQRAGEIVLGGFKLRTDVYRVPYPERYIDPRGTEIWSIIKGFKNTIKS